MSSSPAIDEIFMEALRRPAEKRTEFVLAACPGDGTLRVELLSLLSAHREAGGFLQAFADSLGFAETEIPEVDLSPGDRVGSYEIVRTLGRGGMSTVYLAARAEHDFHQSVAIKVVKPGMCTPETLRYFQRERQVVASLEHPNIARLIDGGSTGDGRPYLAMEYVEGVPIHEFCATHELPVSRRLAIFRDVCAAVHYAHRHLIIHRDLKPSNILVDQEGRVKLLDFGIATLIHPSTRMEASTTIGGALRSMTPRYASPEQMRGEQVTTATDVYSLGVVLYELLTGQPPYPVQDLTPAALERTVCETEPARPSEVVARNGGETSASSGEGSRANLVRRLAGDLDNIVLMALRKEPDRRFHSVEQLSEDLRRHLDGLPVTARPNTAAYRTMTFIRRNRALVGALVALLLVLASATALSTTLLLQAREARAVSESERDRTRAINEFLQDMLASIDPDRAQGRDTELLREVLDGAAFRLESELRDRPDLTWSLHETIGTTYDRLGLPEIAERHVRRALELLQDVAETRTTGGKVPDEDAHALVTIHTLLADLVHEQSRFDEAEALARSALLIPLGSAAEDLDARAGLLHSLGTFVFFVGKFAEAEAYLREAVELRRKAPPSPRSEQELGYTMTGLGQALTYAAKRPEAEPILREAVEIARRHAKSKPTYIAYAIGSLGEWYRLEGSLEEAERATREALEIRSSYQGKNHLETLSAMRDLAATLQLRGDFAASEALYRDALVSFREIQGPDGKGVTLITRFLASLMRQSGRYEEADALFRKATESLVRTLGPDNSMVGLNLLSRALLYEEMGKVSETAEVAKRAMAIGDLAWPQEFRTRGSVRSVLGGALTEQGDFAAAEPLLLEGLKILDRKAEPNRPGTQHAIRRLVRFYEAVGDAESAASYRARLGEG